MKYIISITVDETADIEYAITALVDSNLGGGALNTIKIEVVR